MKKLKIGLLSLAAIFGMVTFAVPQYAMAAPADEIRDGSDAVGGNDAGGSLGSLIKTVINILLFLLGAIAVVMIVIGGIKYSTSNGDSGNIKSAKDTILYSVIGLVVALLAYAIVNFVIDSFN